MNEVIANVSNLIGFLTSFDDVSKFNGVREEFVINNVTHTIYITSDRSACVVIPPNTQLFEYVLKNLNIIYNADILKKLIDKYNESYK